MSTRRAPLKRDKATRVVITSTHGVWVTGKGIFVVCPECQKANPVEKHGFRRMSDTLIRNQSWCTECRAKVTT